MCVYLYMAYINTGVCDLFSHASGVYVCVWMRDLDPVQRTVVNCTIHWSD